MYITIIGRILLVEFFFIKFFENLVVFLWYIYFLDRLITLIFTFIFCIKNRVALSKTVVDRFWFIPNMRIICSPIVQNAFFLCQCICFWLILYCITYDVRYFECIIQDFDFFALFSFFNIFSFLFELFPDFLLFSSLRLYISFCSVLYRSFTTTTRVTHI